jgi:hypothetical protein
MVDIGGSACVPIPYLCSFDAIICETGAATSGGSKDVMVRVDGIYDATSPTQFNYAEDITPELWELNPSAGAQLSQLTVRASITQTPAPGGGQVKCCPYDAVDKTSDVEAEAQQPVSISLTSDASDADRTGSAPQECALRGSSLDPETDQTTETAYGQSASNGYSWSSYRDLLVETRRRRSRSGAPAQLVELGCKAQGPRTAGFVNVTVRSPAGRGIHGRTERDRRRRARYFSSKPETLVAEDLRDQRFGLDADGGFIRSLKYHGNTAYMFLSTSPL